jgi:hypothetical protein
MSTKTVSIPKVVSDDQLRHLSKVTNEDVRNLAREELDERRRWDAARK